MQKRRKKIRKQRYGDYYEKLMASTYYNVFLKRIRTLRKKVNSLGDIPKRETQIIKTLDYFVDLVNLATDFVDKGMPILHQIEKEKEIIEFKNTINTLTCRNGRAIQVQNRAPIGARVTYDTLYIGIMYEAIEGPNPFLETKNIDGKLYQVEVDFAPISAWINFEVKTVIGMRVKLKQAELAILIEKLKYELLKAIENVLN